MTDNAFRSPERVAAERALALRQRLSEVEGQLSRLVRARRQLERAVRRASRPPSPVARRVGIGIGIVIGLCLGVFLIAVRK